MRLAILADVHANLPALEAVIADARQAGAEGYWVAGDMLTGAPFPKETLALLRRLRAPMILGNRERYLLDYHRRQCPPEYHTGQQWTMLRWTYAQLDADELDFLASLPEQVVLRVEGLPAVRMVHGSPRRVNEALIPDGDPVALQAFQRARLWNQADSPPPLARRLDGLEESVLICAHTHIPWLQSGKGWLAVNPGSAGHAANGDPTGCGV